MKWGVLSLLTLAAFITAFSFNQLKQLPIANTKDYAKQINAKKSFSIRCSPLYVPSEDEPIPRLTGWGNYSWKISTSSDSAQFYFNQGINMYYAFHIIEARASFDKATRFDPTCAMAWWGKALAFGPNINDFGYQRPSEAYPSAAKAMEFRSVNTPLEKSLIEAMFTRYSVDTLKDQKVLNELYSFEMKKVFASNQSNADVAALYADALMVVHPWDLYNHNFTPKQWTPNIVKTIKHSLRLNPRHPGANHYFIHAVEASANPGEALKSAEILNKAMPDVSHITHMPSHIYIRTGYYDKGIQQNDKAVAGYEKFLKYFPATSENIALYSLHNLHMKISCAQMAGNYAQSLAASKKLSEQIPTFYLSIPGALGNYVQYINQSLLFSQIRFGKWADILNDKVDDSLSFTSILQHFGRGLAFSKLGRDAAAKNELAEVEKKMNDPLLKDPFVPFNAAFDVAVVAQNILSGVIAGQQKDYSTAIKYFEQAVKAEDNLIYNEPRDWLLPARHFLGNVLLKAGKYEKAAAVFKRDLFINPNNGWALTGLSKVYQKIGKANERMSTKQRLRNAWLISDQKIDSPAF